MLGNYEPNDIKLNEEISNFNGFGISCNGADDGSIDLSVTGGTGSFTYSWTGPGNFTSSDPDISNLVPGTYNVTVTDENDCQVSAQFNITEPDELSLSASIPETNGFEISCNGANDGSIDTTVNGGTSNYTYSWTGPNGFTSSAADLSNLSPKGLFVNSYRYKWL